MHYFFKFNFILLTFFCISSLLSCTKDFEVNESTKKIDNILNSSPDAMDELEKAVIENKIIFVGSGNHRQINDHNFLNRTNIEKLRKLGIKYILMESGGQGDFIFNQSDLEENWVRIFYPWHEVDVQYNENDLRKVVLDVNNCLPKEDQIIMVGLETNRKNFAPGTIDDTDLLNYRDEYMFNVAQKFIDNSKVEEKILIYAGAAHGYIKSVHFYGPFSKKWKPLGSYLNDKYGDNFASYEYISLSGLFDFSFLGDTKLPGLQIKEKFISSDKAKAFNKIVNFMRENKEENLFDGYFIDKNTEYGILHGYALNIPFILESVINQTKEIDKFCTNLNNHYNYNDSKQYRDLEEFLRNIYYLKLFYGDAFDYNLWNPKTKLSEALFKIDLNYKGQKQIDKDKITDYQNYLNLPMQKLFYLKSSKEAKIIYNQWKPFIAKAKELYPEEVWCDYWMAMMNFNMEEYETALKFCNNFINNKLSKSCQCLPEILNTAIESCKKTGKEYSVYQIHLDELANEHNIDVSKISLMWY